MICEGFATDQIFYTCGIFTQVKCVLWIEFPKPEDCKVFGLYSALHVAARNTSDKEQRKYDAFHHRGNIIIL